MIKIVNKIFLLRVDSSYSFSPSPAMRQPDLCAEGPRKGCHTSSHRKLTKTGQQSEHNFVFVANVFLTSKENKSALLSTTEQDACLHLANDVQAAVQGTWRAVYWKPPEITALIPAPFSNGAMHTLS